MLERDPADYQKNLDMSAPPRWQVSWRPTSLVATELDRKVTMLSIELLITAIQFPWFYTKSKRTQPTNLRQLSILLMSTK